MSTPRASSGFASARFERKPRDGSLFWWTVLITLLLGVATTSWFFSIYVFAHPEKPFNYRLLTQLEKIAPPEKFSTLTAPQGQFLQPRDIFGRFWKHTDEHLVYENKQFQRRYLTNYVEDPPLYMKGMFRITRVRPLTSDDVFTSGIIARAEALDYPGVVIEHLFPSDAPPSQEQIDALFQPGDDLQLDLNSAAAVLNVSKISRDRLCFTLVPLVYGTYETEEIGTFSLNPPHRLNLEATWPMMEHDAAETESLPRAEPVDSAKLAAETRSVTE